MSDDKLSPGPGASQAEAASGAVVEGGAYDIIRARLDALGATLGDQVDALNRQRIEVFGGTEMALLGQERVRTENNCVPRASVPLGDRLLLGYNVFLGLRRETSVGDVFSVHRFARTDTGFSFDEIPLAEVDFLTDPRFVKDFAELYTYYKDTRLIQLRVVSQKLLAVFQTSDSIKDVKVMRWALGTDGSVTYIDNRGDQDNVFPPTHDFEWTPTTRENFVLGKHPHVNILDQVFVETVGGDLTIKVENNTDDGQGIYREPVDDANQSLDDAQIHYAALGTLILLKVQPYREETWRYLVFNTRTRAVVRIDAIGQACVQLPEDHGIIFPGGYYLQDGETKRFDVEPAGLEFKRTVRSPNGEDVLYMFYQRARGRFVLFSYNLIRKEVAPPIVCNGASVFDDGTLVVFRAEPEPTRVHTMSVWRTPFMSDLHAARASAQSAHAGSMLVKIGNAELVRGISDVGSLRRAIANQAPTLVQYEDLIAACRRLLDNYHWLGQPEAGDLRATLAEVLKNAELIIDEFEKVLAIQKAAAEALRQASETQVTLLDEIRPDLWQTVDHFVDAMARLRTQRGRLITLREMRYMDLEQVAALEAQVAEQFAHLSDQAVTFLLRDDALRPYHQKHDQLMRDIEAMAQAHQAAPITEALDGMTSGLDLLSEVVAGLKIDDPNQRTRILEDISEVFALCNRARATLVGRRKELLAVEGVAEFGAQFKLFSQSVQSALAVADTPEKCDELLSRLLVQLEELEGRFGEFDQFLADLTQKRDEVYEALNARKQTLLDERQRRVQALLAAAERILQGVSRRAQSFKQIDELNAYYAADAMVLKVRDIADQLAALGDTVKADELGARIKSSRDAAARQLRDKTDLFAEGDNLIRLGKHFFTVNTQPLDLTLLPRDGHLELHLSGTDFHQRVDDAGMDALRDYWEQTLVSETSEVYRAEHLAASLLFDADQGRGGWSLAALREAGVREGGLLDAVRRYAQTRYDEGYDRGVHDQDAALILEKLLGMYQHAGLLRFAPRPRALACLYWAHLDDRQRRALIGRKALSLGRLRQAFVASPAHDAFAAGLADDIGQLLSWSSLPRHDADLRLAGQYLALELAQDPPRFTTSAEATRLRERFLQHLEDRGLRAAFDEDLRQLQQDLLNRFDLVQAWLQAFVESSEDAAVRGLAPVLDEAVGILLTEGRIDRDVSGALSSVEIQGLLGQHPRVQNRTLALRLDEFLGRLSHHLHDRVPGFQAFRAERARVLEQARRELRLDEFKPRVLTSFVRNKLINDVYLPLVGDNLAKQIGAAGQKKRTDLMGLLLLVSPPGYGKTTLMEYVANRLGLIFMKVNGPALGSEVRSFDPQEAPNATARQEVDKINLAFEMGNNVMLYLDDIQHTNPELLQKFISLCDASRRVEGVWRGRTRTYDLRGKKFCVVMAGNPYTESGAKFQIPDMLANRADVYNLGDILGGKTDAFALSFIENALTSNPVLQPLATRDMQDLYRLVRMAQGEAVPTSELSHSYSSVELDEILSVLRKLFVIQQVVLTVNQAYIQSAATDDKFRVEPAFKLQGSYRNMNKMAEKVVAVLDDAELQRLISDHYQSEAQTLTTGAEHNLLKLGELLGTLDPAQRARWDEICKTYRRNQMAGGDAQDPVSRVTSTLSSIAGHLEKLQESLVEAAQHGQTAADARAADQIQRLGEPLQQLGQAMARVSVEQGAQGRAQAQALQTELTALRQAIVDAAAAQASSQKSQQTAQGKQLREAASALGQTLSEAAKSLSVRGQEMQSAQLKQLLDELGQLRQTLVWAAQSADHRSKTREAQQIKEVLGALDGLREAMTSSTQASLRVQGTLASGAQAQAQALLQGLQQLAQSQAQAAASQVPAPVEGVDPLLQVLHHQAALLEGTLVPMVKALAAGLRMDRATAGKLDEAVALLKALEEQAAKGALRGGMYYGPIGTRIRR